MSGSTNNNNITSTTYTSIQNDISRLTDYRTQLEDTIRTDTTLTDDDKVDLNSKLAEVNTMLTNTQGRLAELGTLFSNSYTQSTNVLADQLQAQQIVDGELGKSLANLGLLKDNKYQKIRQVEINDYYGQKYDNQSQLMKILIYMLVPIIVLAIMNKRLFLPDNLYYILVAIILLVGIVLFLKQLKDILSRDNMNYQELKWNFDPSKAPPSNGKKTPNPWGSLGLSGIGTCVGAACCVEDDQEYDAESNKCVTMDKLQIESFTMSPSPWTTTAGFKKPDVTLEIDGGVQPYSTSVMLESMV